MYVSTLPTVAGVMVIVVVFALGCWYYLKNTTSIHHSPVLDSNSENFADDPLSTAERRSKIEEQLIIRKVLEATDLSSRSYESNNNANASGEAPETPSTQTNMPYLSILSQHTRGNRSIKFSGRINGPSDPSTISNTANETDDLKSCSNTAKMPSHPMANIFMRLISQSFWSNDMSESVCGICLTDYKVGDEVAFAPNEECTHGYHTDCIVDWLLKNKSCPICRRDYLEVISGGDPECQTESSRAPSTSASELPTIPSQNSGRRSLPAGFR